MGLEFNADEVFEMAEQIERNGAGFYRRAMGLFADDNLKGLLSDLARMEDLHLQIFTALRKRVAEKERRPTVFDPQGEAALYLKSLADARVFDVKVDPAARLSGATSRADVLRTAIGLEKDSVIFYLGMRDLVPAALGKGQIEKIINEEMQHITILSGQLAKLL